MIYRIYSSIAYFISKNLLKIVLLTFFKYRIRGQENVPDKGPFIMASNHVSYMDPAIVGAASRRRVYFITSNHLYENKFAAWWYKSVGCLTIKRRAPDHTAMRKILNYLKDGKPIVMFPEGGRSEDGKIKEPLSGIGFLALKSQVSIIPCFIKGSEKALPKGAKSFKLSGVTLYIGKPIETKDFEYKGDKRDAYRLFSNKVMNSIVQLGKDYAN